MSVFTAKGDARDYFLMASATFLVFLSHATITFLAVILRDLGVGEAGIGIILSAPLVPMLAGMFLSGYLMERFGPLRVVRAGFFMILLAHLSLQFTVNDFGGVYLSRAFHGFGYGIFQPAGMTYVMGKLRPERMVHPFGIYASMVLLPHIVGPWLMENLYASIGLRSLFLVTAVPSLLGNLFVRLPRTGVVPEAGQDAMGYGRVLRMAGLRPLFLAILIVGLVYGIVPTMMALYLKLCGIPMVYYFTPFTMALFTGRFLVIRLLEQMPRRTLVTVGFLLMGISHLWLISFRTPSAAVLAGIVLGIGYSLEYPSLSVWISGRFAPDERGKPVALLNMVFHAGIFITPLIGGWVMEQFSLGTYLGGLIILALVAAAGMIGVKG
ncbi:MFS transporter [bacterium]|nr:MFS transporter [bacterium]